MSRGLFIVLEGIDGSGTTTQSKLLERWLNECWNGAHWTCEPSEGATGQRIRRALRGELYDEGDPPSQETIALLFAADRLEHYDREIAPALAAGTHVICDRYVMSSMAYQGALLDSSWIEAINQHAPPADLTLLISVSVDQALARRGKRGGPAELYEVTPLQRAVAARYEELVGARADAGGHVRSLGPSIRVDGTLSIDALQRRLREIVGPVLQGAAPTPRKDESSP